MPRPKGSKNKPKDGSTKSNDFKAKAQQQVMDKQKIHAENGEDLFIEPADAKSRILELDIDSVRDNPHQPRRYFDDERQHELVESIEAHGLLNPILVHKNEQGDYCLVAGERRLLACKALKRATIRAILIEADPEEASIIDNIQREDLHPYERALAVKRLFLRYESDKTRVAKVISKSERTVERLLRIGDLSAKVDGLSKEEKEKKLVENNIPLREFYNLLRYDDATEFNAKFQQLQKQYTREPSTDPVQRRARIVLDEIDKTLALADKIKQELETLPTDKDDKRLDELLKKIKEISQIIRNLKLG